MLRRHLRGNPKHTAHETSFGPPTERGGSSSTPVVDVRGKTGSIFSKVETEIGSLLFTMVPSQRQTPRMIANQIRRIRRHDQTTVIQRHDPSNVPFRSVQRNRMTLMGLCWKLLDLEWRYIIKHETLALCASDPGVYLLFQDILGPKFSKLYMNSILGHEEIHAFWSKLIGRSDFGKKDCKFSLGEILDDSNSETTDAGLALTLEYLTIALPIDFKTGSGPIRLLLEAWNQFTLRIPDYATPYYLLLESIDLCVKAILDTGKPIDVFFSPQCLLRIAPLIAMSPNKFPVILNTFYAIPDVKIGRREKHISGAEFSYGPLKNWNLADASSYAVAFTSRARKLYSVGVALPPTKTVLWDEPWMTLYRVADFVRPIYFHQDGFHVTAADKRRKYCISLAEMSLKSLAKNSDRYYTVEEARAAFFLTQSFDIDRYCKRAVLSAFSGDTASINVLNRHSRLMNRLEIRNSLYDLSFMPQFQNVPYLRRFEINGEYFIISDGLPGAFMRLTNSVQEQVIQGCSVDMMLLDGHTLVCLVVDGSFDSTGHYPILAGHNNSGSPLYISAVRVDERWYFSTVEEGGRRMSYFDELGEEQSSREFFVLALRHDPSDHQPPYPSARKGAMDPTGPIFWLRFWPEKDPEYYDDPRLRDDRLLESFLNDLRDRNETERYLLSGFD